MSLFTVGNAESMRYADGQLTVALATGEYRAGDGEVRNGHYPSLGAAADC